MHQLVGNLTRGTCALQDLGGRWAGGGVCVLGYAEACCVLQQLLGNLMCDNSASGPAAGPGGGGEGA
jgi:hypothetical protein